MRILITGVAGHLGGRFAQWLIDTYGSEVKIFGIDDLSCGYAENMPKEVVWFCKPLGQIEPPFEDGTTLRGLENIDYVFHFAAYAAEGLSPFIRTYNYRNNLLATAQVVNFCIQHKVRRLVYTSSMAVYGDCDAPFHEGEVCNPIDPYGNAKLAAERDIQIAGEQHGLDYCIIRPHNIYGPGQDIWTPYRNVFGIWMARLLRDEPMLVYGDGEQQRAFTYIDDVLRPLWIAATGPTASRKTINLGGCEPISIIGAAHTLQSVTQGGKIDFAEARHEVQEAWCTTDRSESLLGYQDTMPLKDGLEKMWEWAKKEYFLRPGRPQPLIEVEEGLYSYWKGLP